jgi:hypothetical protein
MAPQKNPTKKRKSTLDSVLSTVERGFAAVADDMPIANSVIFISHHLGAPLGGGRNPRRAKARTPVPREGRPSYRVNPDRPC